MCLPMRKKPKNPESHRTRALSVSFSPRPWKSCITELPAAIFGAPGSGRLRGRGIVLGLQMFLVSPSWVSPFEQDDGKNVSYKAPSRPASSHCQHRGTSTPRSRGGLLRRDPG